MNRAERRAAAKGRQIAPALPAPRYKQMQSTQPDLSAVHYWPNMNYGAQGILQEYAGYTDRIDAVIQHGVDWEETRVYPGEAFAPCCAAWSWSELRDRAWRPYKPVIEACAPMLYLMETYTPVEVQREGTLYSPLHGTHGVVVEDANYYYHLVRTLRDLPQPVTVGLYYQEFNNREIVRQFEKAGYKVVCTVTDVNSVQSLKNQLDVLAGVKYHASNDLGTQTLYATALGIPAFLYGTPPTWTYRVEKGADALFAPTDSARRVWAEAAEPFQEFTEEVTPEKMEVARFHLGIDRKMDKDTMNDALMWAASLRWPR